MAPVADVRVAALWLVEPHHAEEGRVRVAGAQAEVVLRTQRAPGQLEWIVFLRLITQWARLHIF